MGWSARERAVPDWDSTVEDLQDSLEDVLDTLHQGRRAGVRKDVLALEALDQLDSFLSNLKRDLGA